MTRLGPTEPKSGFEKWQDGINKAVGDDKWNIYDCEIQLAVNEFNRHLSGTTGYFPLDWRLIKAMIWVETGAANPKWKISPIQIGNPGDPGLNALLSGKEGGDLILPPNLKDRLNPSSIMILPSLNIRAGIGYLLMKLTNFAVASVLDADTKVYEVKVEAGDNLGKIAKAHGSTLDILKRVMTRTAH